MDFAKLKKGNNLQSEMKELYRVLECVRGTRENHTLIITCEINLETSNSEFHLPDDIYDKTKLFISKTISDKICDLQDEFDAL